MESRHRPFWCGEEQKQDLLWQKKTTHWRECFLWLSHLPRHTTERCIRGRCQNLPFLRYIRSASPHLWLMLEESRVWSLRNPMIARRTSGLVSRLWKRYPSNAENPLSPTGQFSCKMAMTDETGRKLKGGGESGQQTLVNGGVWWKKNDMHRRESVNLCSATLRPTGWFLLVRTPENSLILTFTILVFITIKYYVVFIASHSYI